MPLFHAPAPESPTATSSDDCTLLKRKESPYWYSDIIFIEENAPQTLCQGAYLHKNFAARTPYKKSVPVPRRKYHKIFKNSKKIVVKICRQTLNISNWRKGDNVPSVEVLTKVCKYLDVSADYLLGLSDY